MKQIGGLYVHNIDDNVYKIGKNANMNVKDCDVISVKNYLNTMMLKNITIQSIQNGGMMILSPGKEYTDEELDKIRLNSDKQVKILFSKMGKNIKWNIYEDPTEAYDSGKKISQSKLNKVVLPKTMNNKIIMLNANRDYEYYEHITLPKKEITYKELFTAIYNFFNEKLTLEQLKKIPNDTSDYVKDAIKDVKKRKVVRRKDIMGSLCRYENIRKFERSNMYLNDVYIVSMGS